VSATNRRFPEREGLTPGGAGRDCERRPASLSVGWATAVAILALLAGSCARDRGIPTYPNAPVILISIDTLRADRLPAYGYTKVKTPFLDRFQQEAWFFENPYTPCPMTLPAHTTMLTGTLPPEHGVRNNVGFTFNGQAHVNLPQFLKGHGYATGAAVSTYVLRYETGLGALFDYYEDSVDMMPGVESVHYRRLGDKTAAFARSWIEKHAAEPFFFFFHIYEPHIPYDPPEPFRSLYGVSYDAEVATSDAIVGAFLEDLKRLGVYDRAIVIVLSDHGEGLGDHGEEQHGVLLYREVLRVPLVVKLPGGFGAGRRVAAPVQLSDLFPTVTALLGLPTPKEVTGASLLTADRHGVASRPIYGETLFPRLNLGWSDLRCVLDARYHYIHGPRPELYDLVADPAELHDLIKSEPTTASRLSKELQRFPRGSEKPAPVDEETLHRLAALGYVGGLRDQATATSLPNPVDSLKYLARMQEGWRLAADKKIPQAIEALRSIVAETPGMPDVWIKLGDLYVDEGNDDESAVAYRQALDRSPVFLPDTAVRLGLVELRLKRFEEAERLARGALSDIPTKGHELLARIALARGDLATAESEARAAAGSRNPQPSAILVLAEVRIQAGNPAGALEVVEQAQERAKELQLSSVYNLEFLRGDALARLNRGDEAEAAFRREIAAFPAHSHAYANLAVIRFIRGDRGGVDRLMDEMVQANPSPRAFLIAATTYGTLGESGKAATWRRRAEAAERQPAAR
jgi:arylsulfatase A-like enzyme/Flp pilus assembly protein TadD